MTDRTTVSVTTHRPQDYVLIDAGPPGHVWMIEEGRWRRADYERIRRALAVLSAVGTWTAEGEQQT